MTKWEYRVVAFRGGEDPDYATWLNSYGADEWELVTLLMNAQHHTPIAFFKRPLSA